MVVYARLGALGVLGWGDWGVAMGAGVGRLVDQMGRSVGGTDEGTRAAAVVALRGV